MPRRSERLRFERRQPGGRAERAQRDPERVQPQLRRLPPHARSQRARGQGRDLTASPRALDDRGEKGPGGARKVECQCEPRAGTGEEVRPRGQGQSGAQGREGDLVQRPQPVNQRLEAETPESQHTQLVGGVGSVGEQDGDRDGRAEVQLGVRPAGFGVRGLEGRGSGGRGGHAHEAGELEFESRGRGNVEGGGVEAAGSEEEEIDLKWTAPMNAE